MKSKWENNSKKSRGHVFIINKRQNMENKIAEENWVWGVDR